MTQAADGSGGGTEDKIFSSEEKKQKTFDYRGRGSIRDLAG
jgi:hypothetical protein